MEGKGVLYDIYFLQPMAGDWKMLLKSKVVGQKMNWKSIQKEFAKDPQPGHNLALGLAPLICSMAAIVRVLPETEYITDRHGVPVTTTNDIS